MVQLIICLIGLDNGLAPRLQDIIWINDHLVYRPIYTLLVMSLRD